MKAAAKTQIANEFDFEDDADLSGIEFEEIEAEEIELDFVEEVYFD